MKYSLWLVCTVFVVLPTNVALAKTGNEVEQLARAITVEIKVQNSKIVGSGVIIHRQRGIYTLVTNRHVVCGDAGAECTRLLPNSRYLIRTADGQKHLVKTTGTKLLGNKLDLAIMQFRSDRSYQVAQVATENNLKIDDSVYTAGFPAGQYGFSFDQGKIIAAVNKRLTKDSGGYTVVYNAATLPGMSGSGVYDRKGQLVAIHGQGDQYKLNTDIDDESKVGTKIGFNRGIPVKWLLQGLAKSKINLDRGRSTNQQFATGESAPARADEYFIAGFNRWIDPGNNIQAGKRQAVQELTTAIKINPKYTVAYFIRAYTYENLNDLNLALSDWNKVLELDPKYPEAYSNRGTLKASGLNDVPGAITDYSKAIEVDPKYAEAYYNRGLLKAEKIKDLAGALVDYNQAIILYPQYARAYYNRAILKRSLNDLPGALSDYDQAIKVYPEYALAYNNRANLKANKFNDVAGALIDYDKAIDLNPGNATYYYNRGILKQANLRDFPGALADYNQAIDLNPKLVAAYHNRGILKKDKLQDFVGALADFSKVIELNPNDPLAYYSRGLLKKNNFNDRAGAIQDLRQAAQIFRQQNSSNELQRVLAVLRTLGVVE
jgi:tetratricopeptide (TPR) repeat protein